MANPLRDRFAEILLDRIRGDIHPSATHMNMLEAVASPRMRVEFILLLMEKIDNEPHPSLSTMHRVRRLIDEFGY